ncbi:MAG: hypothetical protein CMN32_08240 [Saprospirales bacterium]|jgi:hypothetical protein|nr:hypothetical protein [Saprospirales bacterium]
MQALCFPKANKRYKQLISCKDAAFVQPAGKNGNSRPQMKFMALCSVFLRKSCEAKEVLTKVINQLPG